MAETSKHTYRAHSLIVRDDEWIKNGDLDAPFVSAVVDARGAAVVNMDFQLPSDYAGTLRIQRAASNVAARFRDLILDANKVYLQQDGAGDANVSHAGPSADIVKTAGGTATVSVSIENPGGYIRASLTRTAGSVNSLNGQYHLE